MTSEERRLQRIDALLCQEPVDRLRELLSTSEADLVSKRSAVVELIGDAYPEVLRCASAIAKIHSNCKELLNTSNELKPLQSILQGVLLAAVPNHSRHIRERSTKEDVEHIESETLSVVKWLNVDPYLWDELVFRKNGPNDVEQQEVETDQKEMSLLRLEIDRKKRRRIHRRLLRSYDELPRLMLDMLSHSKPLQGLFLLTGWGPLLRRSLLGVSNDACDSQRAKHVASILSRQKSYFSCYDLLNRTRLSAYQALVAPFPSPWSSHRQLPSPFRPPRCQCSSCQPWLQCYSYQGISGMLEILMTIWLLDPSCYDSIQTEIFDSRLALVDELLNLDFTNMNEASEWDGNCELIKSCFSEYHDGLKFNMKKLIRFGFQLSSAIRIIEVTNQLLLMIGNQEQLSILQDAISKLFNYFSNSDGVVNNCDCYFCSSDKHNHQPVVHIWNDCSNTPIVAKVLKIQDEQPHNSSLAETFTSRLKSKLLTSINEVIDLTVSECGIHSLQVINGIWRLIYSLVLTDRLWWSRQLPFGATTSDALSNRHVLHNSLDSLLIDPSILKTSENETRDCWSNSSVALPPLPVIDDILLGVAEVFDKIFDRVFQREIKKVVDRHFIAVVSQDATSYQECCDQFDMEIGFLTVKAESILSFPGSWYLLFTNTRYSPGFDFAGAAEITSFKTLLVSPSSVGQRLLKSSALLSKSHIVKLNVFDALIQSANSWFTESLQSYNSQAGEEINWGRIGWRLSFISHILDNASDISITAFDPQQRNLPFISWIFKVTSVWSTTITPEPLESALSLSTHGIREIAHASLYLWAFTSMQRPVNRLLADLRYESMSEDDSLPYTDVAGLKAIGWKPPTLSSSSTDTSWCVPSHPRPTLSQLLFAACLQLVTLHQQQTMMGMKTSSVVLSVYRHCRRCMVAALSTVIFCSYASIIEVRRPCFTTTVQMLFDLEWADVLLSGKGPALDQIGNADQIVPSYLKPIWKSNKHTNLSQLQIQIKDVCLEEVVDRLLYSTNNLRPVVLQSLETQLLLVAPLISTDEMSGPLFDLQEQWKNKRLLSGPYETQPPVAPLASRLPLLPIASHNKILSPPSEARARLRMKQTSTASGDANAAGKSAHLDYTVTAAAALREMKEGFLSSNVAADLGSLGSSVSNISSFLRGHVEGLSSKVTEAMKARP